MRRSDEAHEQSGSSQRMRKWQAIAAGFLVAVAITVPVMLTGGDEDATSSAASPITVPVMLPVSGDDAASSGSPTATVRQPPPTEPYEPSTVTSPVDPSTMPGFERIGGTLAEAGWRYLDSPPVDLSGEDTFLYRIAGGRWVAGQAHSCAVDDCRIWVSRDPDIWQPRGFAGLDSGRISTITASQGALWAVLHHEDREADRRMAVSMAVSYEGVSWQSAGADVTGLDLWGVFDLDDLIEHHFGDALQAYLLRKDAQILLVQSEGAPILSTNAGAIFHTLSGVAEQLRERVGWWGWVDDSGYHLAGAESIASSSDGETWIVTERSGDFPFPTRNMYSLSDSSNWIPLSRRGLLDLPLIATGEEVIVPTSSGTFARSSDLGLSWEMDVGPFPFEVDRIALQRDPDTGASWFVAFDERTQRTWVSEDAGLWYSTPGTVSSWRVAVPFDESGIWVPPDSLGRDGDESIDNG